jgi:hypothetical protein
MKEGKEEGRFCSGHYMFCCCCLFFEIESHCAAQVGLELVLLLPQPPECDEGIIATYHHI